MVKIMVVDDFKPWREFVPSIWKKRADFNLVGVAENGSEAIARCQEFDPDIVLLDLGMPDLDGMEVLQVLRTKSSARVIIVSNESASDIVEEALRLGAAGYVLKTDAGRDLLPAIDRALKGEKFTSSGLTRGLRS